MLEDLCRAIVTKNNKKYECVTFKSELTSEAQYQKLEDNHIFDFCIKQSFSSSPYMGAVSKKTEETQKKNTKVWVLYFKTQPIL